MRFQPEEIILAALGFLWLVFTYLLCAHLMVDNDVLIQVLLYNLSWIVAACWVWKKQSLYLIWPLFLGALAASWCPLLTWQGLKNINADLPTSSIYCTQLPLYATWYSKFIIVFGIVVIAYSARYFYDRSSRH